MFSKQKTMELDQILNYFVCDRCDQDLKLPEVFSVLDSLDDDSAKDKYFTGFNSCNTCKKTFKIEYSPSSKQILEAKIMRNGRRVIEDIASEQCKVLNIIDDYVRDIKIVRLINKVIDDETSKNEADKNFDDKEIDDEHEYSIDDNDFEKDQHFLDVSTAWDNKPIRIKTEEFEGDNIEFKMHDHNDLIDESKSADNHVVNQHNVFQNKSDYVAEIITHFEDDGNETVEVDNYGNLEDKEIEGMNVWVEEINTTVVNSMENFNCNICGVTFLNKMDLKDHCTSMLKEMQYICDICYKQSESKISLETHIKSMHDAHWEKDAYDLFIEPQIIEILQCNGLDPHLINGNNDPDIECDDSLISVNNILLYNQNSYELTENNSIYEELKDVIPIENETKANDQIHNYNEEDTIVYKELEATNNNEFVKNELNIDETTSAIEPVPMIVNEKNMMNIFQSKHQEKLLKSENKVENDLIIRPNCIQEEILMVKLVSERMRFSCDHCDKVFNSKSMLNFHIESKQYYFDQIYKQRSKVEFKYIQNRCKCDKCNNSFDRRYDINDHKITLHKQRKYSCDLCNHKSKKKENLKMHMKGTKLRFTGVYFQFIVEKKIRNMVLKFIKEWKKRRKKK